MGELRNPGGIRAEETFPLSAVEGTLGEHWDGFSVELGHPKSEMCPCPPLFQPGSSTFSSGSPRRLPAVAEPRPQVGKETQQQTAPPGHLPRALSQDSPLGRCSGNVSPTGSELFFPVSLAQIIQNQENQKENLDQRFPSLFKKGRRKTVVRNLGKMIYYSKVKFKFQHCQVNLRHLFVGVSLPRAGVTLQDWGGRGNSGKWDSWRIPGAAARPRTRWHTVPACSHPCGHREVLP